MKLWSKFLGVILVLISAAASSAVADSISFVTPSLGGGVTVANNGSGGIGFTFSNAFVSGATPFFDSLNSFPDNPFNIGTGIVLNGAGAFTSSSTSVQVGDSASTATGLLTGNINFITIVGSGSPGAFAINISLSDVNYSCIDACVSSSVLSNLAFGGNGNLTFTFGFDPNNGPQGMSQLLAIASTEKASYTSRGFTGTIDTIAEVPEPASLALFGSGLVAAANFTRRKFRSNL
jgi:hypothetical protein